MNKLKTLAAVLFPLALLTLILSFFPKEEFWDRTRAWFGSPAASARTETSSDTPAASTEAPGITTVPSFGWWEDFSPDSTAVNTTAVGSSDKPLSTTPTRPKPPMTEDGEASVPVFGDGGGMNYITEFEDAGFIHYPVTTTKEAGSGAFVTEFPDTTPITIRPVLPEPAREEMRAVYVATVYNLDFPSGAGKTAAALKSELEAIVNRAAKEGFNTIIFQVRPASDALYQSAIFPSSRFLTGKQGASLPLDPLAYLIKIAHAKDIAVHAWINPYRVTLPGENLDSLSPENPARKHPDWTYTVGGQVYYDPALPAVRALVAEGIAEILLNYNVDGVMFDDYFYPSNIGLADIARYEAYQNAGGELSLSDWRRENVNRLIELSYRTVKEHRPDCLFGVAPRGIWRNASDDPTGSATAGGGAYDEIYCDALAWVKNGWLDYLSPQIYWSFSHKTAPFGVLADWWNKALAGTGIRLVVSLAGYSLPESELLAQKAYLAELAAYGGFAFYSFSHLK